MIKEIEKLMVHWGEYEQARFFVQSVKTLHAILDLNCASMVIRFPSSSNDDLATIRRATLSCCGHISVAFQLHLNHLKIATSHAFWRQLQRRHDLRFTPDAATPDRLFSHVIRPFTDIHPPRFRVECFSRRE